MKKYFVYLMAVTVMFIAGCEENKEFVASAPATIAVTGISISDNTLEIEAGSKRIINVTLSPADATKWFVSWESSDVNTATVETGRGFAELTGIRVGTATLTATTEDGGHTATCTVTVIPRADNPVVELAIEANTSLDINNLEAGRKILMVANVFPPNAYNKAVKWTSSDEGVATISDDGVVICISKGSTTITAESDENPEITATLALTVTNDDVFFVADFDADAVGTTYNVHYLSGDNGLCEVVLEPLEMENKTPSGPIEIPRGTGKALNAYGTNNHAEYGITGAQSGPEFEVTLPKGKLGDFKFLYLDMYFVTAAGNDGVGEPTNNWNAGAGWAGAGSPRLVIKMDDDNSVYAEDFGGNPREMCSRTFPENDPFNANYFSAYTWARGVALDLSKLNMTAEYQGLTTFRIALSIRSGAYNLYMDNVYLKK